MKFIQLFKDLFIAYILFIAVDSIWLTISKKYWAQVNDNQPMEIFPAAALAYVALSIAIVLVAYPLYQFHKTQGMSELHATLFAGMLTGFSIYFCYDMTNRVIFGKKYPWILALTDAAWGTFATAAVLWLFIKIKH